MLLWGILAIAVVVVSGLAHWILTAPEAEGDLAKARFRLEQDSRSLRRAGKRMPQ